jgi:hypothetical protein
VENLLTGETRTNATALAMKIVVESNCDQFDQNKGDFMRKAKTSESSEEYRQFENLAKQLIAVPKSEIDKREAEYQRTKKHTKKRKHA